MDTIIQIYCNLLSGMTNYYIKYTHFSHKCYYSGEITPARINTPYVTCIYGVQSVITRFHHKFRLILEIDC